MRFLRMKKSLLFAPLAFSLVFSCKTHDESEKNAVKKAAVEKKEVPQVSNLTLDVTKVNFDYDKSDIKVEFQADLGKVAEFLKKMPKAKLELDGHCDERGTTQYNLGLGQRRADSVRNYLKTLELRKVA